jgi:hypothetical protein
MQASLFQSANARQENAFAIDRSNLCRRQQLGSYSLPVYGDRVDFFNGPHRIGVFKDIK